ncbi:MAG: MFS transporter, partial [Streptomyces sp.]|nr:MFS transporter [Streptomyces sp.]
MTTTPRTGPNPAPVFPSAKSEAPATDNRPRPLLALVLAAQFMALLDVFIVNVAAPTIGTEL